MQVGFLVIILYRSNILSPDTPTQKYLWMYVHDCVRNNRNLFQKCSSHGFASGHEAIILQACSSELLKTLLPWTVFDIAIMTRCPISQLQRADAVEHWHLGANTGIWSIVRLSLHGAWSWHMYIAIIIVFRLHCQSNDACTTCIFMLACTCNDNQQMLTVVCYCILKWPHVQTYANPTCTWRLSYRGGSDYIATHHDIHINIACTMIP